MSWNGAFEYSDAARDSKCNKNDNTKATVFPAEKKQEVQQQTSTYPASKFVGKCPSEALLWYVSPISNV